MPTLAPRAGRIRRSRASAHRERGQVLILFVMGATVIFVIGAIVVDIGLWVSERRNAQAAADLAALAAATQLRDSRAAGAKGLDFAKRNGYDDAHVRVPGDVCNAVRAEDCVTVEVHEDGPALFSGIFGVLGPEIGASATASYTESPPGPGWVLFANSSQCDTSSPPVNILANHLEVTGSTHSNGNIHIEGPDDNFFGPVTWVCPDGLDQAPDQQNTGTYRPPPYPVGSQPSAIPVGSWSDVPCTANPSGGDINADLTLWDVPGVRLKSNVICSDGDLFVSGDGISGHVTLAANRGKITITSTGSAGNRLQPADSLSGGPLAKLLAVSFASSVSPAIDITASGGTYDGYIYAPNSRVAFNGSADVQATGSIVADTILISGNNFKLTAMAGLGGPPMPPEIHLED